MKNPPDFPRMDEHLPFLDSFFIELVEVHKAGELRSWNDLDKRVKSFYTPEIMNAVEAKAPGWKKMASYSDGITLTHVNCVFLGMYMLAEYQELDATQKELAKWIVLFHDIDKIHVKKIKDTIHPFKSAVVTARDLPSLGFPTTKEYSSLIESWGNQTSEAVRSKTEQPPKPDNLQLPEILSGIDRLFEVSSPAALIIKIVLLHTSLDVDKNYPTPAPLNEDEIRLFISPELFPLLKVMMLSDNEGWSLFDPDVRAQQRRDTLQAFEKIGEMMNTV